MNRRIGRVFSLGFAALLLAASYQEAVVAWSLSVASLPLAENLDRASAIAPLNAAFLRERGILRLDSDPRAAELVLRQSVSLNAFETDALVGLGLIAESDGRLVEAEEYLIRAAHLSRLFKPRYALAFFYARQGPLEKFWHAASSAANIDGADATPAFRLAHDLEEDPKRAAELLSLTGQHALRSYAGFLLKEENRAGLGRIALRIEPTAEARPVLLEVVDSLISGNGAEAISLWNRLTPDQALAPEQGRSLTNGRFAPGENRGFDWRCAENPGVEIRWGNPGDLRIEFSGHQSESLALLEQFVPVVPDRTYQTTFRYGTDSAIRVPGLKWQVLQPGDSGPPASMELISSREGSGTLVFHTKASAGLVRLILRYDRTPGAMRIVGIVTLRSVELRLL